MMISGGSDTNSNTSNNNETNVETFKESSSINGSCDPNKDSEDSASYPEVADDQASVKGFGLNRDMLSVNGQADVPKPREPFWRKLRFLLRPDVITPLPVLEKPVFPWLTDKIIRITHTFIPGASPPHEDVVAGLARERKTAKIIRFAVVIGFSTLLLIALILNGYSPETVNGFPQTVSFQSRFWGGSALSMQSSLNCGFNGVECMPFSTGDIWFGFHCRSKGFTRGHFRSSEVRGGKQGIYSIDSHICFAAIHAGVIKEETGGCFETRLVVPPNPFFNASESNGVKSTSFGWLPSGIQFRSVTEVRGCEDSRWASGLVICLGFIALSVIWRVEAEWMTHIAAQWGFYYVYLVHNRASGQFWLFVNDLTAKQFTLIPMCVFLLYYFPGFCPNPKRFPLEALFNYLLFFWIFIHMLDLENEFDANFSFSPSGLKNLTKGSIALIVVIGVVTPPLVFLQGRVLYRAGLFPPYLIGFAMLIWFLLVIGLASDKGMLEFHLHHYFVGLILCVCGRGQKKYSIMIQAIGLGLFVEGLSLYDTDPLFGPVRKPNIGYDIQDGSSAYDTIGDVMRPLWSRAEIDPDVPNRILLEWVMPNSFVNDYNCSSEDIFAVRWSDIDTIETLLKNRTSAPPDVTDDRRSLRAVEQLALEETEGRRSLSNFTYEEMNLFNFYLSRNGVLFPFLTKEYGVNVTITDFEISTANPVILTLAVANNGPASHRLPVPFPNHTSSGAYYNWNATLCERVFGIYTKLRELQVSSEYHWWLS